MPSSHFPTSSPGSGAKFAATRWSLIRAAGDWRAATDSRRAMGELLQLYWFPLYAYLRLRGNAPAQAEDLVQGYFTRLLEKDVLASVHQSKGKFRSFLLASLKNYLANQWDKDRARKRGGDQVIISFDAAGAEARYADQPISSRTPEQEYDRRWALAVLEQVLHRLGDEYARRGQAKLFAALQHALTGGEKINSAQTARQLGMSQGAVKVASHRLRRRYRDLLRLEISQTVSDPSQVDEEIHQLLRSL